jgi:hypothetical protein
VLCLDELLVSFQNPTFLGICLNYGFKGLTLRLSYELVLVVVEWNPKNSLGFSWVKPLNNSRAFGKFSIRKC